MKRLRVVMGAGALCGGLLIGNFARGMDLDGDGVSDVYLDHFGIAPIGIDTDMDDDGYPTGVESHFGTDPTSPASRPALALTRAEAVLTLQWPTVDGIVYQLQASDDLTTWIDDGTFVLGNGSPATATRSPEVARRFYRLGASHGPDEDGDGLDLYEELLLGTDPTKADTDGDGISDGDEVSTKTSPTNPDSDGDGKPDGTNSPTTPTPTTMVMD